VTTAVVLCTCGHGRPRHYGELAPQCSAPSCTCLRFRPDLNAPAAVRTPGPAPSGDSTARPTLPRCTVCSHGKKRHEVPGFAPSCVVSDCECSQYTDQDSVTPEASKQPATFAPAREAILALAGPEPSADAPEFSEPPAESAPTVIPVDELLRRGHESELKPIARLAERIDTLLEDLRDRLADEAAATGVKDLISDLELTAPSISPVDFMSAAPAPLNGSSPWASRYAAELRRVVVEHASRAPRSLQLHLGPSELGVTCDRQVAGKMAGLAPTNHVSDPWPSIVGTAVHAWLADAFTADNTRHGLLRWVAEQRVTPHPDHPGTADLYDAVELAVVDHKILGETSLAKVRAASTVPRGSTSCSSCCTASATCCSACRCGGSCWPRIPARRRRWMDFTSGNARSPARTASCSPRTPN
jgi:hypothetical protein